MKYVLVDKGDNIIDKVELNSELREAKKFFIKRKQIDEKEFNCGYSNVVYRGGTGGHIFKILLNPSINSINNWFDENKKTPLINEKKNTMSEYGIYNVFARSWTMLDNQFVISIHGSSCDIAGYQECFKRYEASFEKGFSQIGDTSSKLK